MATGNLALGQEQGESSALPRIVNDFTINVATVNGSGSQSANSVLLKSIFGMGVPGEREEPFPVEHRRIAHVVHDPRQQRWLCGAQA